MIEIPLTRGLTTMVDDQDAPDLLRYNWSAMKTKSGFYAGRKGRVGTGEKRTVLMHRQIMNPPPDMQIDHRDSNGLNNQRGNLRLATGLENRRNRKLSKNARTPYKGIWQDRGRWGATVRDNGRKRHLGLYLTAEQAAQAYDIGAKEVYGEFAKLNFPGMTFSPPKRGTRRRPPVSQYRGVGYDKGRQRWTAAITVNGRSRHIGRYESELAAARAYDQKARELYGEDTSRNFA